MEELQAIKEIVKANSVAVYQDSAQPSVRILGKALAQCVSLFAVPVGRMAEIFEKNLLKYIDKLEGLSNEQIKLPETRVLVPILERLRYTDDEVVADYYAQILATASMVSDANKVSVAFIEILNRLCSDEIKILEFINSSNNNLTLEDESGEKYELVLSGVLPVIDVHIKQPSGGYIVAFKNSSYLLEKVTLNYPNNFNIYLDNMIALGLLLKPAMIFCNDKNIYEELKKGSVISSLLQSIGDDVIDYSKRRIETTELGKQLLLIASKNK